MIGYIILATINGLFIGASRSINSRLSMEIGPFRASFWNHIIGFLFITLLLIITNSLSFEGTSNTPLFIYLGGFFGALFVAVNSYVFPRIGAIKTVLLVISGQMITSVLIDISGKTASATAGQLLGVAMILFGVYLSKVSSIPKPIEIGGEKDD